MEETFNIERSSNSDDINNPKEYWNNRYCSEITNWDLGQVSPPIKEYIDQLSNKKLSILIPGCGNSYEAEYLLQQGFTDITVLDIAPSLVQKLQNKFQNNPAIKILQGDFFEHSGKYDLVLEQTFFCAIQPTLRLLYVSKMKALLLSGGKIAGLLFGKEFENAGPPFGGSKEEYQSIFKNDFIIKTMEPCYNSFTKRQGSEIFIILEKNEL